MHTAPFFHIFLSFNLPLVLCCRSKYVVGHYGFVRHIQHWERSLQRWVPNDQSNANTDWVYQRLGHFANVQLCNGLFEKKRPIFENDFFGLEHF